MQRILYSLKQVFRHRAQLQVFLKNSEYACRSVLEITPEILIAKNIQVLVLDFDGVLSAHAAQIPQAKITQWLTKLQKNWSLPIFILSNNPFPIREQYFKKHFPDIRFITDIARKPYPDGLLHIATLTHVAPQNILMVDDRLLTGILAAVLACTKAVWITKPIHDFKLHFFKEIGFMLLRKIDMLLLF